MKKRVLGVLLASVLSCALLTACGDDAADTATAVEESAEAAAEEVVEAAEEVAAPCRMRFICNSQ